MLILGLAASALVVVPSVLFISYLVLRRRQLWEARAYARVRALRAMGQRMAAESGAVSQRYSAKERDQHAQRFASRQTHVK